MNEPGRSGCADAREQISAACDDEAQLPAVLAVHVEGCAECREFAQRCRALALAFEPLRRASPPPDLEARLLARAPAARPVAVPGIDRREGAGWRAAAGLVGLLGVGALGAWSESRSGVVAPDAGASWIEPLSGRALHPDDAPLRTWAEAMGKVVREERR